MSGSIPHLRPPEALLVGLALLMGHERVSCAASPLLVAMGYVFYGFHVVCDEFFVPALQVMCERLSVPDSVAGATVMAAGASSPEMFTNFISIFAFRSDVGTGTVVGSELFNQLVICGTCAVQCKELTLDWRLLVRELGFYSLSVIWLYLSLCQVSRERVTWLEGLVFVLMQTVYVVVCVFTPALVSGLCPGSEEEAEQQQERRHPRAHHLHRLLRGM